MKQVDSYGIIVKCIKVNISRANTKCAKKHIAAYMYVSRKKICERAYTIQAVTNSAYGCVRCLYCNANIVIIKKITCTTADHFQQRMCIIQCRCDVEN